MVKQDLSIYMEKKFDNWLIKDVWPVKGSHTMCKIECNCGNVQTRRLTSLLNGYSRNCKECLPSKQKMRENKAIEHERTKEIAYYLWLGHGCPEGRDLEFWLDAEVAVSRERKYKK